MAVSVFALGIGAPAEQSTASERKPLAGVSAEDERKAKRGKPGLNVVLARREGNAC